MTISEVVKEALVSLDKFNLEVAEFRVRNGMSLDLRELYGQMGRLNLRLIELEETARGVELLDKIICDIFTDIKRRNGEYENS